MHSTPEDAWTRARETVRPTDLAKKINVTPQAVSLWKRVPAEKVVDVETATGIPREKLRPDLYRPALPDPAPSEERAA